MEKPSASGGVETITVVLGGLLCLVALAAIQVYWTAGAVIDAAQDKDTYALFITDAGIASDNQELETKVNHGLAALRGAREMGLALLGVCLALGGALALRVALGVGGVGKPPLKAQPVGGHKAGLISRAKRKR